VIVIGTVTLAKLEKPKELLRSAKTPHREIRDTRLFQCVSTGIERRSNGIGTIPIEKCTMPSGGINLLIYVWSEDECSRLCLLLQRFPRHPDPPTGDVLVTVAEDVPNSSSRERSGPILRRPFNR
jgi:hypothetical protein